MVAITPPRNPGNSIYPMARRAREMRQQVLLHRQRVEPQILRQPKNRQLIPRNNSCSLPLPSLRGSVDAGTRRLGILNSCSSPCVLQSQTKGFMSRHIPSRYVFSLTCRRALHIRYYLRSSVTFPVNYWGSCTATYNYFAGPLYLSCQGVFYVELHLRS